MLNRDGRPFVLVLALAVLLTGAPPAVAQPLPCTAALVATVDEIVASLPTLGLPPPAPVVLEAVARAAVAAANAGDRRAALAILNVLEAQVRFLVAIGRLDPGSGDALIDLIAQARATLGNCTSAPPITVFNCRSGDGENTLLWINPEGGGPGASTRILFRTDRYPQGPADPLALSLGTFAGASGAAGRAVHPGLVNGQRYYYAAYADDGGGVLSPGRLTAGRPQSRSGAFRWSYTAGGIGRPAVGGLVDALATASSGGFVYGLEPGLDGGRWVEGWTPAQVKAPAPARPIALPFPVPGLDRPIVVVSSLQGYVQALDAETGVTAWVSPPLGGAVRASVCAMFGRYGGTDDVIVVGTANPDTSNRLYGIRPADGAIAWSFDNGGSGLGPLATQCATDYARHQILFTSGSGATAAAWALSIGPGTASLAWSTPLPRLSSSLVPRGDVVYGGTSTGEVHALDATTGDPLWTTPYATGDGPVKDFVFPAGDRLSFSTSRQVHLIRDAGDAGVPVWTTPVTLRDPNVPLLRGDRVFVTDTGGVVYVIDATVPTPTAVPLATVGDPARPARPGLPYLDTRFALYSVGLSDGVLYSVEVPR